MSDYAGMISPDLQTLPKVADRMTFLYLEQCKLSREDSAIVIRDDQGSVFVPAAAIHVGHENSFIYDIADLYKAEIVIPLAFQVAAENSENLPSIMRRRTRDAMVSANLLERMVKDVRTLLKDETEADESQAPLYLWNNAREELPSGHSYGKVDTE